MEFTWNSLVWRTGKLKILCQLLCLYSLVVPSLPHASSLTFTISTYSLSAAWLWWLRYRHSWVKLVSAQYIDASVQAQVTPIVTTAFWMATLQSLLSVILLKSLRDSMTLRQLCIVCLFKLLYALILPLVWLPEESAFVRWHEYEHDCVVHEYLLHCSTWLPTCLQERRIKWDEYCRVKRMLKLQ